MIGDLFTVNIQELERLAALVNQSNIQELTLKQGANKITLRSSGVNSCLYENESLIQESFSSSLEEISVELADSRLSSIVTSPVVGIFRHVRPAVGLGAQVQPGQVIAEIEAMGIKNEVSALHSGVVIDVLVEDMQPVEYDQYLFEIESEE